MIGNTSELVSRRPRGLNNWIASLGLEANAEDPLEFNPNPNPANTILGKLL